MVAACPRLEKAIANMKVARNHLTGVIAANRITINGTTGILVVTGGERGAKTYYLLRRLQIPV
jgi:hypothetical protein